ncbi:hypothetical protein NQ315_014195 [Exocentrus adspersus]|uniref:C2H2-type domain-containing protein n=1 Tax=Exocentrus adspersus TaxID=1586481 RepID=A0AAV8V590_9CUCU|nr:hypothetical protein NQ315_014195 [Exocentrus adspersus]
MSSIKKFREIKTKKRDNKKSDTICVVCCKTCSKRDFEETGDVAIANEILDMLLLERDQIPVEESVMCLQCFQKVNIIFEFKSACLYVEDFITPFVNIEEGNRVDLKEVYMRQKGNKDLIDALLGRDLCRLCMSVVDNGCVYLDSSDLHDVEFIKEMIKRYIPEINVNNTRNAIVCGTCVGCLKDFCNFMESYSESRSSSRSQTTGRSLEADTELDPLPKNSLASSNKARTSTLIEGIGSLGCESSSRKYQCEFCDYKAKRKQCLTRHMFIHKNPSEIEWFECGLCDYKANRKDVLKNHMSIHKKFSEIEWLRCYLCDFKTKSKRCLKTHTLIHKDPSEIEWFKCHFCDYKAKQKSNLKSHTLVHKNSWEIKWFECHLCDHKTKYKNQLKYHTLVHKNPSENEWFKCYSCDFKAKSERNLKAHTLIHKKTSEIKWFKCNLCDYKAKQRVGLKTHTLIHKNPLEIKWFKCHLCNYKAKQKVYLKRHMLVHKNSSEIAWFECDLCDYKSKRRGALNMHKFLKPPKTRRASPRTVNLEGWPDLSNLSALAVT